MNDHELFDIDAMAENWLTADEAADYLKVKPASLLRWTRAGKVQAYAMCGTKRHVWRFRVEDLDSMLLLSKPVLSSAPSPVRSELRRAQ